MREQIQIFKLQSLNSLLPQPEGEKLLQITAAIDCSQVCEFVHCRALPKSCNPSIWVVETEVSHRNPTPAWAAIVSYELA